MTCCTMSGLPLLKGEISTKPVGWGGGWVVVCVCVICQETRQVFLVPVQSLIEEYVAPKGHIIIDCWNGYESITQSSIRRIKHIEQ